MCVLFVALLFFFSNFLMYTSVFRWFILLFFSPGSLVQDNVCIWFHVEITGVGNRPAEIPRAVLRTRRETLVLVFQ